MRNKILAAIMILTAGVVSLTLLFCVLIMYRGVARQVQEDLRQDAAYISQGLGTDPAFVQKLPANAAVTRITLIDAQGQVLFDNRVDAAELENHGDREEFIMARQNGRSSVRRVSQTMSREIYYYAERLPDGKVVRVARSADSILQTVQGFLPAILGIMLVICLAAYYVARLLTIKLVAPLAQVDLDHPLEGNAYDELAPFLRRIDKQNKMLAKAANLRREFTANVSHELKTPLQSISGYAELIGAGIAKKEDVPRFIDKIRTETARLIGMVDNIMKLSKLDEGRFKDAVQEVDLCQLVQGVCAGLQEQAAAQQLQLKLVLPQEPCLYEGIASVLEEMVFNLVENALKYNRPQGSVTVQLDQLPSCVRLAVMDTGIGIAKEEKERIFERFYRSERSHSSVTPGNGLGLSIVKHAVQLHRGTIDVASVVGEGTTITVRLKRTSLAALENDKP